MAVEGDGAHALPSWFVAPGEVDSFAWLALGMMFLALYGVVTLYAAFDRWAEHRSKGTPLAKTIPTLLAIALLYEIFPLDHFSVLLPLSAILIAAMMDWSRYRFGEPDEGEPGTEADPDPGEPEDPERGPDSEPDPDAPSRSDLSGQEVQRV
ncbi:MAG: hypothetical protein ACFB03_14820 [Paracoccaceae bacterium]